jgi:riboflavin kinase/FMN adenylyltransferase
MLVIGYNHRFGKGGTTIQKLYELSQKFEFAIHQFPCIEIYDEYPSSTKIRNLLLQGNISKANKMLDYKYILTGTVTEGKKLGRSISYPTANIITDEPLKLIPQNGVYACLVKFKNEFYRAMTNIGTKPTVNKEKTTSIEVHILNFNTNIYSEKIEIHFITKIRDEIKFPNIEKLKEQIDKDKITINNILNEEYI